MGGTFYQRFCRRPYSGLGVLRLWRGPAAALVLGVMTAGCSMSYQLDSLFSSSDKSEKTGTISPPPGTAESAQLPPDHDLAYTRAAVSEVLNRDDKYASVPWENPRSGARGTVTPIASSYTQDGHTCRDFLASYVNGASQAWMQGEACKQDTGGWQVRTLKPWKRS